MSEDAASGLFVELATCVPEQRDVFEAHAECRRARRQTLSGVQDVRRYRDEMLDSSWLTVCETASLDVLPESASDMPADELAVEATLTRLERRCYVELEVPQQHQRPRPPHEGCLLAVWWTPAVSAIGDFHAWYDQEHIPRLLEVPGWLAVRRFELAMGTGPHFLALHYLTSAAALSAPEHQRAVATRWRARVAANREQHERRLFVAWRNNAREEA